MRDAFTRELGYGPRKVVKIVDGRELGIWRGWGWFIIPEWNITIAAPPKCGSSSLKQFFYMHEMNSVRMIEHNEVNRNSNVFFVVRNPEDRFASLWKSKCRDNAPILDKRVYGMSPNELVKHIIDGNSDVHWTPQIKILGNIEAKLIPLEKLNEWWANRGYGDLGRFNKTEGDVELGADILEWIKEHYAEDHALYKKALDLF